MRFKLTLAIIASLVAGPAIAEDNNGGRAAPSRGTYIGIFGGGGLGSDSDITQLGTAFFTEAQGGPLAVNATGRSGSGGVGFVGAQIGHEWSYGSAVMPAFEMEGFYLASGTRSATLQNPSDRLPEHAFDDTFPTNNAVFLANMVLSFRSSYPGVTPYIGGGIGAARVSVDGANSLQIDPPEAGINHFNSGTDSAAWTFAAQAKAGVRIALGSNAYLFGEYRYLYVGSTDQIFGPTIEATHVPTTAWTVTFDETSYHLATAGIGFDF
jgi:opacity protein-like surface antigen